MTEEINPARDQYIDSAITKCINRGQEVTLQAVASRLPNGFDLDDIELARVMSNRQRGPQPDGEIPYDPVTGGTIAPSLRDDWGPGNVVSMPVVDAPPEPLSFFGAPRANGDAQPSNPPPNSTPEPILTHAETVQRLQQAQEEIATDRNAVRQWTAAVQAARGRLHEAVSAFLAGDGLTTAERQLAQARAYQATSQAERAARAAKYGNGTSASARAYVAKQMRYGGSRGGYSNAQRSRLGFRLPDGSNPAVTPRGMIPAKTGS